MWRRWSRGSPGRTALTLRVQTGCDERAATASSRQTRGASRSQPLDEVMRRRSQRAVAAGYKEIAITGVHLGSYGRDLGDGVVAGVARARRLRDVARRRAVPNQLARADGLHAGDRRLVGGSPRLAPHFHLPLQHGSDEMLACDAAPVHGCDYYRRSSNEFARVMPHAVDRLRPHRRLSRRDRSRRFEETCRCPASTAAHARPRVSLLGSAGHRGARLMPKS